MFRIDSAGATQQNMFTAGDPAQGIPATEVSDVWLNAIQEELANVVEKSGLALNKADSNQLAKGLAILVANGDFYTDSGAADAYVLTPANAGFAPTAYGTGLQIRFIPANTNTGASTVDVNTLGVKSIKTQSGADPAAGDLAAGEAYTLYYDGANFILKTIVAPQGVPTGALMYFPASVAPNGFLKLNGVLLNRTTYANLYAYAAASGNIIDEATWAATQWGSFSTGDLATTFRIPDLRGEFLRAFDDARGIDINRILGSWQADDFKAHTHGSYFRLSGPTPNDYYVPHYGPVNLARLQSMATGGTETRGRNITELACIKY